MEVWTRAVKDSDRERLIWVEKGATPGLSYINDVWEPFIKGSDGEFSAAFCGDELGGMGKLTRLYEDYAWLEALRVHPNYQGRGLGKAIYDRYMEQIAGMGLKAVGMYTNYENVASRSLAERYGLSVKERFSEYVKADLTGQSAGLGGLRAVKEEHISSILPEQLDKIGKFIVLNRTFYPVRDGLFQKLAANKWLYTCGYGIIIMGYRFQPRKALHIAFMQGDKVKLLKIAEAYAVKIGAGSVSAMRSYDDEAENEFLTHQGFIKNTTDYITLWKGLV